MRKIEERMLLSIRSGWPLNMGNTRVSYDADGWAVYLHGNRIAWSGFGGSRPSGASLCGWDTPTTRSRLRALGVDVWKLRLDQGYITQEQYMKHLRAVENERTRRKLAAM